MLRPRVESGAQCVVTTVSSLAVNSGAAPIFTTTSTSSASSFGRQSHLIVPTSTLAAIQHLQRVSLPVDEVVRLRDGARQARIEVERLRKENVSLRGLIGVMRDNFASLIADVGGVKTDVEASHSRMTRKLLGFSICHCTSEGR